MKKCLIILLCTTTLIGESTKKEMRKPVEAKHSNFHLQKVTNKSPRDIFFASERTHIVPMSEEINLSGHIMPEKAFEIIDPEGIAHAIMIPEWQGTFRGNTINIVSLSGNPGRIYYLYVIKDHLWALKAPSKEGELKGVHLLEPSEEDVRVEVVIEKNNIIKAHVLDQNGKRTGLSTKLTFDEDNFVTAKQQERHYVK